MQTCCRDERANVMSDMVEKGLPFKEVFACINDNQISIRVQEPIVEDDESECDSPCDCLDPLPEAVPRIVNSTEENLNRSRTVTITENEEEPQHTTEKKTTHKTENTATPKTENSPELLESKKPLDMEENPNIFVLKVRKRFGDDSGTYTLDVDFKVPRPWSKEMRDHFDLEYNGKPRTAPAHHKKVDHNSKKKEKAKNGKVKNGNGKKKKSK